MKRLSGTQIVILSLAIIGAATYVAKKKLPPFQAGFHDVVQAQSRTDRTAGPRIAGCPVLPADNVWNTAITGLPKDPKSDAYLETAGVLKKVHPDFGSATSGIPYSLVPPKTRGAVVEFEYRDDSDLGHYPIPDDAPVEGRGDPNGDRHVLLIEQQRCLLYELFGAQRTGPSQWKAGSGAKFDLTSNSLREEGKTSADAAGLPIFPGLVRYEEVQSGAIHHALRFTLPKTQAAFIWPARHKASSITDRNYPPMGQRFRLRADFDISKFSPTNQVILKALQTYGMILADNGGPFFLTGVMDKRWDDDDLHRLGQVKGDDFEAVDESGLQVFANSGRVDPLATH